ncbi:MAG: ferritin family protein [Lentisphaeria bacterium]|nr:ferritin family protein [Lentisphaeria bacterium]
MSINYDVADLINSLIDLEKNGCDFYTLLAEKSDQLECQLLFKLLAEQEKKHEEIYTSLLKEVNTEIEIDSDYHDYLQVIVDQQFSFDPAVIDNCKDISDALDLAIKLEKDSLLFLSEFGNLIGSENSHFVDKMKKEERAHLKMLAEMKLKLRK